MYCTANLTTKKPKQLRHLESTTRYITYTSDKNDHFSPKF
nr:MAG TPA: hypothetical protein [Caudoviricetes sp.]